MLRRRTREHDCVTMVNRGTLLALRKAAPGREGKKVEEGGVNGKGPSQDKIAII